MLVERNRTMDNVQKLIIVLIVLYHRHKRLDLVENQVIRYILCNRRTEDFRRFDPICNFPLLRLERTEILPCLKDILQEIRSRWRLGIFNISLKRGLPLTVKDLQVSEIPHTDTAQNEGISLDEGNRGALMGTKELIYSLITSNWQTDRIIIQFASAQPGTLIACTYQNIVGHPGLLMYVRVRSNLH
jgi:hypothetical protein